MNDKSKSGNSKVIYFKIDVYKRVEIWQVLDKMLEESREMDDDGCAELPVYSDEELISEAITLIEKILGNQPYVLRR
jgi:hypothetical protein